jgi:hypothetical protein
MVSRRDCGLRFKVLRSNSNLMFLNVEACEGLVVLELIARSKRDIHVASDVILTSIRSLSIPTPRVDSSVGWAKRSAAQQAGFASHHVMLGFTAFSL